MYVIDARGVNGAYKTGMRLLMSQGVNEKSRAGDVLAVQLPVTTVYSRPQERVLFDERRDANPFFHVMESVWMLAGRQDARWLDTYVKDFSKRYAEEDGLMHGAYGYRWRKHFHGYFDQILQVGSMLFEDPTTRRAVLGMWDPSCDLGVNKLDLPCNTNIFFRGRWDAYDEVWELDMTVCCRSNDIIWGAYGANAVHMSILAEVMAGLAGMRLGRYYQISNNFHAYNEAVKKVWPPNPTDDSTDLYTRSQVRFLPIIPRPEVASLTTPFGRKSSQTSAAHLLEECILFTDPNPMKRHTLSHPWMVDVVVPMARAHAAWRGKSYHEAVALTTEIVADDWRYACRQWMERRIVKMGLVA